MKEKKVILLAAIITSLLCFGTYQVCKQPVRASMTEESRNGQMTEKWQTVREAKEEQHKEEQQPQQQLQQEQELQVFRAGIDRQTAKIARLTGLDTHSSGIVLQYAEKYNMKPSLLLAVMRVESNFYQYAVGKSQDRGYFQIIPASEKAMADMFGNEVGLVYNPERIFEPEYNIGLAAAYIHWLQSKYKNDIHRVLSEYNKGPGKMAVYYEENGTYETNYSQKVMNTERKYDKSLSY